MTISTTYRFSAFFLLFCPIFALGQIDFTWFETKWVDSFREVEFFQSWDSTKVVGSMTRRWPDQAYSAWDFRFGENSGEFEVQKKNSPEAWTFRHFGTQVTAQTRWPGYIDEWRISLHDTVWILKTEDRVLLEDWICEVDDSSYVRIFTEFEGDKRTWLLEEEGRPITGLVKLVMGFISYYVSIGLP